MDDLIKKIACIQMTSCADVDKNLREADQLIRHAAKHGAKFIVLPENFAFMGLKETDKLEIAELDGQGPIQEFLSSLSAELSVWLVGGTLAIRARQDRVTASCLVFDNKGERLGRYDKIHLFDVTVPGTDECYLESATIEAGNNPLVIDTPFGRVGFSVCYDIRFPELFRKMAAGGMDILVVPSAFTEKTGSAHWEVLVRARAIENQCYVIAPNQWGEHENGRKTFGHSMIVNPWGEVVASLPNGSGAVISEFNAALVDKIRATFPALKHREL